ncbi:MAG: lysoplasmalogenase [Chitinophagaceae bacterium]|nr:lysoplasmalogenase [Chitinophagaceae bacterium]
MPQKPRVYFLVYFLITMADLLLIYSGKNELRWFTKPLLMPLLLLVVYLQRRHIPLYVYMLGSLALSWAGDLLLQMKGLFIPGLISFLLAHVCYIVYFVKISNQQKGLLQLQPLIGLPVLIYIIIFLWLLYPFLDTLKIPVTVYGITIGAMLLMSINTKLKVNAMAAALFFNGALQFVISDSILAVNLFAVSSMILSLCVMATYASAQYLLVRGSMQVAADLTETK